MAFKKQTPALDLETTAIENIFLTEVLPMAEGNALKVYLLGYRYACDPEAHARFSHEALARHLGITLQEVLDAWQFWEDRGLIRKTDFRPERPQEYSVEFISLRQLYVENNFKPRHEAQQQPKTASPERIAEAKQEETTKKMFREVERIIGRPLSVNETMDIIGWIDKWSIEPGLVIAAFEKMAQKKGSINRTSIVKYTEAIVRNWHDQSSEEAAPSPPSGDRPKALRPKTAKPNRFHNFEGWLSKLSEAEVDELIKSRNKL